MATPALYTLLQTASRARAVVAHQSVSASPLQRMRFAAP
jgi:hypothetical protein